MSVDDYGSEYQYPPAKWGEAIKSPRESICAQDERFNILERSVEHLTDIVDALLEKEAPRAPDAAYAHIPIAEWLDITEELEALRAFKAAHQ